MISMVGIPLALLTTLVFLNSACTIGNWSPASQRENPLVEPSDQRGVLSFSYTPESRDKLESNPQSLPVQSQLVKDLLERHSKFRMARPALSAPALGTHVNVYQTVVSPPSPWCTATLWTFGVIPCYFEGIAYETHFELLLDNTLKKSYRYPIRRWAFSWIGLFPFFLINVWIDQHQYNEAFSGNTAQFIAEAKRDGFL